MTVKRQCTLKIEYISSWFYLWPLNYKMLEVINMDRRSDAVFLVESAIANHWESSVHTHNIIDIINDAANNYSKNYNDYCALVEYLKDYFCC